MTKRKAPVHPVAQAIISIAGSIGPVSFKVAGLDVFVNPNRKTALVVRKGR